MKSEQERKRELEVLRFEKKKANHETNSAVYTSNIKTQFLANMSHEIRTPMNSVLGFLTLIENGLFESEDELKDFARNAKISADSLLDIINNILDISKIEAGKMELYEDDFNIQDEIDKAQSIVTPSAKEKGLKLSCVIEENVPRTLIGDATRYRQVLVNLLGNAVKYSESGEINIKVEVAGKTEATAKILTVVKDQGPGIAQDKIPTLFKPYSQVRSKKWVKEKGTGLGLMICKEFVNLMGGEISIESKVGEGTKISFTVVLTVEKNFLADREKVKPERDFRKIEEKTKPNQDIPKIKEPDISETVKTETIIPEQVFEETADTFLSEEELEKTLQNEDDNSYEINSLAGSQKSKKRLLLVEDNPISQSVELKLLREAGYAVDPVSNGYDAIEAIKTDSFDLVLMDIEMSDLDGIETTKRIRELDPPMGLIPIIAVTAHSSMKDREKCLAAGMDDYIAKPININFLKMTIDQWLYDTR